MLTPGTVRQRGYVHNNDGPWAFHVPPAVPLATRLIHGNGPVLLFTCGHSKHVGTGRGLLSPVTSFSGTTILAVLKQQPLWFPLCSSFRNKG